MRTAFPNELLLEIAKHMPELERAAFSQTSKRMRAIAEAVPFKEIRLGEQTPPQILRIVRFIHQNPMFITATEEISIKTPSWEQGRVHQGQGRVNALLYRDTNRARVLIDSLEQLRDAPDKPLNALEFADETKTKWLQNWIADEGYLIPSLAWIVFNAGKLRELHLNISDSTDAERFFKLLYHTHAASLKLRHQCFAHLERLEMTLFGNDAYIPLVAALTEVVLTRPGLSTFFDHPDLPPSGTTRLRLIELRGSDAGAQQITRLLRNHTLPNIEKIWIEDEDLFWVDVHSELFDLFSQKSPKIRTLVATFRFLPESIDVATIAPPNAHQLETVTYFGTHHLLLPQVGPDLDLQRLAHSVPRNVEEVNIQGLKVDSIKHVVDNHKNGERIQMTLPTELKILHLSFDVNAKGFRSPRRRFRRIKPALDALSRQLGESGHILQVHVRNMDSTLSEEKFVF